MEYLMIFISAMLTSAAIENAAFARALGLNKSTLLLKSRVAGIIYGGETTVMLVFSSLLVSLINYLLQDLPFTPRYIRAPLFLLGVLIVYFGLRCLLKYALPQLYDPLIASLPVATFNTALFGVFYISANQRFNAFETTGYALGTGLGYTAALLIIYYARKRLAISPVPKSFRGLPILLVYIGLLSLAIYGLIGHGLPT